jgi:hypothetical protein
MPQFIVDLAYTIELTQAQIAANQAHLNRMLPIYQKLHELETVSAKNLRPDEHELVSMEWFDDIRARFEEELPEPFPTTIFFNLINFYENRFELYVENTNLIGWVTYYYNRGSAEFYQELVQSYIDALVPGRTYCLQTTNGKRLTVKKVISMIANKDLSNINQLLL